MSYIHPPSLKWLQQYKQISDEMLAEKHYFQSSNLCLFHIGSTAVPNLFAKNCIDILAVVDHLNDVDVIIQSMERLDFLYKGEYGIAGRYYFSKNTPQKIHLHLFKQGAIEVDRHLHFINIMKANPTLINELNQLKLSLVAKYPDDKERYQSGKQFFYDKVLKMIK